MDSNTTPGPARRRSVLRKVLIGLAALAALLVIAVVGVFLLVDTNAVEARVKDRVLPQISERIGRKVTVDDVKVSVLPAPRVRLEKLQVEGAGERPLVASEVALARLDVWTLIASLGKEIRLESVELRDAELNVVRFADGSWELEQILDRVEASKNPEGSGGGRQVAIGRVTITKGVARMIDYAAPGGTAVAELQGIEATARHIGRGEPMALELKAALQSQTPNFEAQLQIDPLPTNLAALQPGHWPQVTGSLQVRDAPIGALRNLLPAGLDQVTTGGLVRLSGRIKTEDERYVATGTGGIKELQLRGHPAEASFAFTGQVDPATKAAALSLRDLVMKGPGIDLGGTAQVWTGPIRFEFALAGGLLDLDTLMGIPPVHPEEHAEAGPAIPPAIRTRLKNASGSGTLSIDRLVSGKLTATDVQTRARLEGGVLTLDEAQARFYGGTVRAGGTTANLTEKVPTWHLVAEMQGVALAEAMNAIAGFDPLNGTIGSAVDLRGAGIHWAALRDALTGTGSVEVDQGQLRTFDLEKAIGGALAEGLRAIGKTAAAGRVEKGAGATALDGLRARFRVADGWMNLQEPITVRSAFGTVRLNGRIGLDWQLDLKGTAQLAPDFVAELTGGAVRPSGSVEIPIEIGGTLRDPAIGAFDTEAIARALLPIGKVERQVEKGVQSAEEKARREAERQARKVLRGAF